MIDLREENTSEKYPLKEEQSVLHGIKEEFQEGSTLQMLPVTTNCCPKKLLIGEKLIHIHQEDGRSCWQRTPFLVE